MTHQIVPPTPNHHEQLQTNYLDVLRSWIANHFRIEILISWSVAFSADCKFQWYEKHCAQYNEIK